MKFNRMPVVCSVALALVTAMGLSGCSFSEPTVQEAEAQAHKALVPQVTQPVIQKANQLTVGIRSSYAKAPMYIKMADGSLTGLDVDMASALADNLGLNVNFIMVGENDTPESAKCDIIMDVTPTDKSNLTVVGNYCEAATAFFTKGAAHTANISEINGKKVALQSSSASQQAVKQTNLSIREVPFENLNKAFEALQKGEVDYVMCDAYSGAYLANLYNDISMVGTLDVPQAYGVGVSSTNVALQQTVQKAMDTLASNGLTQLIHNRWVGNIGVISADSKIQGIEKKAESDKEKTSDSSNPDSALKDPDGELSNPGSNAAVI